MKRDIQKYQACLFDIKQRVSIIVEHFNGTLTEKFLIIEVEFLCLQFRKILELIALSSLVANKEEYSAQNEKFAKHYNARLILQDLERINPDFYPTPTKRVLKKDGDRKVYDLQPVDKGFLTKQEFIDIYEKCGGHLHAANPYGHKRDLNKIKAEFPIWLNKIITLLNHHTITLVDRKTIIIGVMHGKDGMAQAFEFNVMPDAEVQKLYEKEDP